MKLKTDIISFKMIINLTHHELCCIFDITTNLIFVKEYKNKLGEVIGKKRLVDMP
jgi:hypothetical protein